MLSLQAAGGAGQGAAGRVAGAQGAGVQRRQNPDRPLGEGFDFLGFNLRRYPNGKLLIKPSKGPLRGSGTACRRSSAHCAGQRSGYCDAQPRHPGLGRPITGRWCRPVFTPLTNTCGNSPTSGRAEPPEQAQALDRRPVLRQKFDKFRHDRWVFGDRDTGAYLAKFAWTEIVRHVLVRGGASPDDPALAGTGPNGAQEEPPLDRTPSACCPGRTAAARSAGTCSCPPTATTNPPEWEQWCRTPAGRSQAPHLPTRA